MKLNKVQQDAVDWALGKASDFTKAHKLYNISAIVFLILDILCTIVMLFYTGLVMTTAIAKTIAGLSWINKFVQIYRLERLSKSVQVITTMSLAYIMARKKRSEFMKNVKVTNLIIAALDLIAVILGIVLVFVEPNTITTNIEAVVCGLGTLLGVNIAIPCFNNAKFTETELEYKKAKKEAKDRLKKQNAKLLDAEIQKIQKEQASVKIEVEPINK